MPHNTNNVILFTPFWKPVEKHTCLVTTTTKEPGMPTRLYYRVNPRKIVRHFYAMGCVQKINGCYLLLYQQAMGNLNLGIPAHLVAPEYMPVVIGRALVNYKTNSMIIDTDSYQRAINIVECIANHTTLVAAQLEQIATYNRYIFTTQTYSNFIAFDNYEHLFANLIISDSSDYKDSVYLPELKARQKLLLDYPLKDKHLASTEGNGIETLEKLLETKIAIADAISMGRNCSIWDIYANLFDNKYNV